MDENADKKPGQEPEVKKTDYKDLIGENIERRSEKDFEQLHEEIMKVLCRHFPSYAYEFGGGRYLNGKQAEIVSNFFKELKPTAIEHFKKNREKDFNNIITNLGSYLEMMNH